MAAIRWYVDSFHQHHPNIHVAVVVQGEQVRLSQEFETVIFRLAHNGHVLLRRKQHAQTGAAQLLHNPMVTLVSVMV